MICYYFVWCGWLVIDSSFQSQKSHLNLKENESHFVKGPTLTPESLCVKQNFQFIIKGLT